MDSATLVRMRRTAMLLCLLAATACDEKSPANPSGPINQQFVLAPGGTAAIDAAGISVRFMGVLSDSRCPADAICVTAGDAVVRIEVIRPSAGRSQYDLHEADKKPATHGDLRIALVQLEPYPLSARTIPQSEYRATLRVTRGT